MRRWAWLGLVAGCTCASSPKVSEGPDIVLITVDTLRADRLGFAGHTGATTPHLDALAARGRVFSQATTPLPRTTPALASALTGLRPPRHGSVEVGDPIRPDVATLASVLQADGWQTLGLSAMQVAGPDQGLDHGFDRFEVHHDARASDLVDQALALPHDGRRFLWIHLSDPHFPYLPPGEDDEPCRAVGEQAAAGDLARVELFIDLKGRASELRPSCERLYDGEIAEVDRALGRLLEAVGDEAWVLFSADHGEHLGEEGLFFEHGPTVHQANLAVPLVVAGPGIEPGVDSRLAQLVDILPTALALAGVSPPEHEGLDLLGDTTRGVATATSGSALQARLSTSLVSGRAKRWCLNGPQYSRCVGRRGPTVHDRARDPALRIDIARDVPEVAAALAEASTRWGPEQARERSARDARYQLVARPVLEGGYRLSLYDLLSDPTQSTDLAEQHPEVVERLQQAAAPEWGDLPPAAPRSADELEQLRALGYVE